MNKVKPTHGIFLLHFRKKCERTDLLAVKGGYAAFNNYYQIGIDC